MLSLPNKQNLNFITSYAVEKISSVSVNRVKPFFENLPVDPYLAGSYRFRRFSHVRVLGHRLVKLPHTFFYQSKDYNPLLGNVKREYPELEDELLECDAFKEMILTFFDFCRLCSNSTEIGVHQIRIIADPQQVGNPAPEGIHQDGVDLVGIVCIQRDQIEGGETHLYQTKEGGPIFTKILNPGEMLAIDDREFFNYTTPINAISIENGVRDVFVLTCPGLPYSD